MLKPLKMALILICCETSGAVREALRTLGHDACSCDILPADDGSPYHIQGDVFDVIASRPWAAFGAHPPCTYLGVSGIHWNNRGRGWERTNAALAFVARMVAAFGDRPYYVENPVSILSTHWRRPDQIIQPNYFGEDASKKTCLWTQGLPRIPTLAADYFPPRWFCNRCKRVSTDEQAQNQRGLDGYCRCHVCADLPRLMPRWANQTDSGQNKLAPSADRWKARSKTYPKVAAAMAAAYSPHFTHFNFHL